MTTEFPTPDVAVTLLIVVRDVKKSRSFYTDVLGAELYREYGGDSAVLRFQGTWLLLVTGGGPTPGKPTVTFEAPQNPNRVSHQITLRVPDCRGAYETLRSRGAEFLAEPNDRGGEIRAFLRDPDGHLIEISEVVPT